MKKNLTISATLSLLLAFIAAAQFSFPRPAFAATLERPINILNLQNGLVGWWTFDGKDMPLGAVNDRSGSGNNGNFVNMATSTVYVPGKLGQALAFNGSNQYINAGTGLDSVTGAQTYTAWVYANSASNFNFAVSIDNQNTGRAEQSVLGFFNTSNGTGFGFTIIDNNAATAGFLNRQWSGAFPMGQWVFVAGTWDGTATNCFVQACGVKVYINGVEKDDQSGNSGANFVAMRNTGQPLAIGTDFCSGASCFQWNGEIDDVRIYNRALSATEIAQLYTLTSPTKISSTVNNNGTLQNGLVGWWTFDGKTINWATGVVSDQSGQGNNGQLTGGMSTTTSSVPGKIGQALQFGTVGNESTDYRMTLASDIIGTSAASVCVWAYPTDWGGGPGQLLGRFVDNGSFTFTYGNDTGQADLESVSGTVGVPTSSGNGTVSLNVWQHFCVTRDTSGSTNFYKNGAHIGTANQTGGTPLAGTTQFTIADRQSLAREVIGKLDDMRIYNRILSAAEIAQLYSLGSASHVSTTINPPSTLQSGLVGWWTFDGKDMPSGAVNDRSGSGNNGNFVNMATSTTYVPGKLGQALAFNGKNQSITIPSVDLSGTPTATVSFWMFKSSFVANDGLAVEDSNPSISSLGFHIDTDIGASPAACTGTLGIDLVNDNTSDNLFCFTLPSTGAWHNITAILDTTQPANGEVTYYLDGVLQTAVNHSISADTTGNFAKEPFYIGSRGSTQLYYAGMIDDVRVYNRALSAAEIKQLYNMGK